MSPRYTPEEAKERINRLLSWERQEEVDVFRLLAFLPIEPHQTVADIGCGPGYFAIPLAKALMDGKLIAVDITPEMLEELERQVQEARLGNVEIVRAEDETSPLPAESVDGALVAFTLHEIQDRTKFIELVGRSLRPGGWLGVVEWLPEAEADHPKENRLGPDDLRALGPKAGLEFREWRQMTGKHYLALLRRPRGGTR